ncbi:tetratricopeptide repeat-containing sensor histidine kinase [Taibaiella koreensis]|uniref:tetratricopeptide repeat-containing sensor histidine kinase n=1 Tax=Taibaiella koreensis TaxID=1268548 RepID=UPI0013C33190|nr:tetratricopeptide repeat protein [Taibaiella koreensis]
MATSETLQYKATDSAIGMAREALAISQRLGSPTSTARSLLSLGNIYYNARGEYQKSKHYFFKALSYYDRSPLRDRYAYLYTNIGNVYMALDNYDSANWYFFKALDIINKKKVIDTAALGHAYANLGANFSRMGIFNKAIYYLRQSLALAIQRKDSNRMAPIYHNIAAAYNNTQEEKDVDSAIKYYNYALRIYLQREQLLRAQQAYCDLGVVYLRGKHYSKAMAQKYLDAAIALAPGAAANNFSIQRGLGALYYLSGNDQKAIPYLERCLSLSRDHASAPVLDVYMTLANLYQRLGNYRKAYSFEHTRLTLIDSLARKEKDAIMNQLEIKYRTAEKDKQLVLAQSRLRAKNTWFIAIAAGSVILSVLMVIIYQKQRLQLQRANLGKQQQRVAQLKAVIDGEEKERSRIGRQLHDDVMVQLSIVKMGLDALAIKNPGFKQGEEYKNLLQQLDYTSQNIRQTAHNLMPDSLLAEGLLPAVGYFCTNITKMTGLPVNFQHDGDVIQLPIDTEISIYRMIQELVQNVIKHASAANILVQLYYVDRLLSITVEDDGIGFNPSQSGSEDKMGLKSIQTRLKALNGALDIHACEPHGTSVNLTLVL